MRLLQKLSNSLAEFKCNRSFLKNDEGVAAIEFALIFPTIILVALSMIELLNYNMISRRASFSAEFAAEFVSRDDDHHFGYWDRRVAEDIFQIVNNTHYQAAKGKNRFGFTTNAYGDNSRGFSVIDFEREDPNCQGNDCAYKPQTRWVLGMEGSNARHVVRPCDQKMVSNSAKLDETKFPEGFAGRSTLVIADIYFNYRPILANGMFEFGEKHVIAMRNTRGGKTIEARFSTNSTRGWYCPR